MKKQMRILTAANHAAVLEALTKELSDLFPQAEIIRENDALMAGKYAFNHDVDIVFAEADMKRMNGLQLIRFVRHEHPGVKSYLIGSKKELAESDASAPEDVSGMLVYPLVKNAIRELLQRNATAGLS